MRPIVMAPCLLLVYLASASAAEPVLGNWKTTSGEIAKVEACGGAYCITVITGLFKGKQVGRMDGSDGSYVGEITDPEVDKTYAGHAVISGASMKLTGCTLKIFCKTQVWFKQS